MLRKVVKYHARCCVGVKFSYGCDVGCELTENALPACSWGSYNYPNSVLGDAIRRVCNVGGLFILAAGNEAWPMV
jgi:hypothetical protein